MASQQQQRLPRWLGPARAAWRSACRGCTTSELFQRHTSGREVQALAAVRHEASVVQWHCILTSRVYAPPTPTRYGVHVSRASYYVADPPSKSQPVFDRLRRDGQYPEVGVC
jgi:hypothetical protein